MCTQSPRTLPEACPAAPPRPSTVPRVLVCRSDPGNRDPSGPAGPRFATAAGLSSGGTAAPPRGSTDPDRMALARESLLPLTSPPPTGAAAPLPRTRARRAGCSNREGSQRRVGSMARGESDAAHSSDSNFHALIAARTTSGVSLGRESHRDGTPLTMATCLGHVNVNVCASTRASGEGPHARLVLSRLY
jgi:hypothetical protein